MLQPTLTRRLEEAIVSLNTVPALTALLGFFEERNNHIDSILLGMSEGGNKVQEGANALHSNIASIRSITQKFSAKKLFKEVEILQVRLSAALGEGVNEPQYIYKFMEKLDAFSDVYSHYIADQTGPNGYPLLVMARDLRQSLSELQGILKYISDNSSSASPREESEAEFSFAVPNITDLGDFAAKIAALNALYAELCFLMDVSAASHPLRIRNIESGSLWTWLYGEKSVIGFMISVIESSIRYIHRNHTNEGKIATIPKKIETVEAILQLSNRLESAGVDVGQLKEKLAKCTLNIADSLNTLVSGQPEVEVNGKSFSIGAELHRAFLEKTTTPKLGYDQRQEPVLLPPPSNDSVEK